jgi:hypothetical protein
MCMCGRDVAIGRVGEEPLSGNYARFGCNNFNESSCSTRMRLVFHKQLLTTSTIVDMSKVKDEGAADVSAAYCEYTCAQ